MDGRDDGTDRWRDEVARWRDEPVLRLTVVLLAGGFPLIGLGAAGVAGSPLVVLALLGLAGGLYALRPRLSGAGIERVDRHRFYADLPLGPLVGAVVALTRLDATPGELQALGGLLGLAGIASYFLRPVYHLLYRLGLRVSGATR